jgi:hypothetical protein
MPSRRYAGFYTRVTRIPERDTLKENLIRPEGYNTGTNYGTKTERRF